MLRSPAYPLSANLARTNNASLRSREVALNVGEVTVSVEADDQTCFFDKTTATQIRVKATRQGSSDSLELNKWGATLHIEDLHPEGEIVPIPNREIPLTPDNDGRLVGTVAPEMLAGYIEPVIKGVSFLKIPPTDGDPTSICSLGNIGLGTGDEPFLTVRLKKYYLRSVHRECPGKDEIPTITLPPLPSGASWSVTVNDVPKPDPHGNQFWAPGVYKTPLPDALNAGPFKVDATGQCSNGQVHLKWDGIIIIETENIGGGLPLAHPMLEGVDLATGTYHLMREDLHRPGLAGGLSLVRSFSNAGVTGVQSLGRGWSFNYEVTLEHIETCNVWLASDLNGTTYEFNENLTPFPGFHGTLTHAGDGYQIRTKEGILYDFISSPDPKTFLMSSVKDALNNKIQIQWNSTVSEDGRTIHRIQSVWDPANRSLNVVYSSDKTEINGADGERIVYEKDEKGFLKKYSRYQGETFLQSETYTYDEDGREAHSNLLSIEDPDGRSTDITYFNALAQEEGYVAPSGPTESVVAFSPKYRRVKTVTKGKQLSTSFKYDLSPLGGTNLALATVTNGLSQSTDFQAGIEGEPRVVTDACTYSSTTNWDLAHMIKNEEIDALGRETTFTPDDAGNITDEVIQAGTSPYPLTDGDGNTVSLATTHRTYDSLWNRVKAENRPDGLSVTYAINSINGSVGSKTESGTGLSRSESYGYDSVGNLQTVTDFNLKTTTFSQHDLLGNARHIDYPVAGNFVDRNFDSRGRQISETTSNGKEETWIYDDLDRLTDHSIVDHRGFSDDYHEHWIYTTAGLLREHTDSLGLLEHIDYDSVGRKKFHQLKPSGDSNVTYETTWNYDDAGRIEARTDPDLHVHKFHYKPCGQQEGEDIDDVPFSHQNPDRAGNILSYTDARGATTVYGYDALYRKIRQTSPEVLCLDSSGTGVPCHPETTYLYDLGGRLTRENGPEGAFRILRYDGLKRLEEEETPFGHKVVRHYDLMDRIQSEDHLPQGMHIEMPLYDDLGRVRQQIRTLSATGKAYTTDYVYDDDAHTISKTVTGTETTPYSTVSEMDSLGRIGRLHIDPDGPEHDFVWEYHYDGAGHPKSQKDPNLNETTTLWDALGRKLQETSPPLVVENGTAEGTTKSATQKWTYDFANRIVRETNPRQVSIKHEYDAQGRETKQTLEAAPLPGNIAHLDL